MEYPTYVTIDGIKWYVVKSTDGSRHPEPLCPQHHLRLTAKPGRVLNTRSRQYYDRPADTATMLECAEGPHTLDIPRDFSSERKYVVDRLDALFFEKATYIYLDDLAIPVATENLKEKDSPVWVRARVTESKSGLRLIVWAGDRSEKSKTQLFVEPEISRLSFDQNDDHPLEVFAKVEATFARGRVTIERPPDDATR